MPILSIQSHVAYGRVGNRLAAFALERLGFEVWPVPTVVLSNHPGYGAFRGRTVPAVEVAELLRGIEERGAFPRCEAVLSGYLGDPATGPAVLDTVARVKAVSPDALYCLAPVMGDGEAGFYVDRALEGIFRDRALPESDLVVANRFEAGLLAGRDIADLAGFADAARTLIERGPRLAVVSGFIEDGTIATVAASHDGAWLVRTPRIDVPSYGAGDLLAAVFLARYLKSADPPHALALAVSGVHGVFRVTARSHADHLDLVAAQDEIVAPSEMFEAAAL
jgi:pyridoxine kinase